MADDVAEPRTVNKPGKSYARPLADLLHRTLGDAFAKQGFASTELVTRWTEIVGAEIAAHSEPEKIQWPRPFERQMPEPGILVLRVEGPMAIEIQHLSHVVLERVNRFFGWRAVGGLRLRQAPLRRKEPSPRPAPDPAATALIAAGLSDIGNDDLRDALARLGAAIKQS
jgi:hypothetical protein